MNDFSEGKRPPQESVETPRPTRVLVAEDDPLLLRLMQATIGNLDNVNATFCTTGEEATELIRKAERNGEAFDRIITDNGLAGKLTGFDVAKAAKEMTNPPVVVLLTGSAREIIEENTPEQLREKGIGFVAGKPLGIDKLRGLATTPVDQLDQMIKSQ